MNYLVTPNLPKNSVKVVLVDGRIETELEKSLNSYGIDCIKTFPLSPLYKAISGHPDILFHHIGKNIIVYAPGVCQTTINSLSNLGFKLIMGRSILTSKYPGNICYNGARVGNYLFHNTKYTDEVIKSCALEMGVEIVHVNQGYTKCSISIVDENSIITMDKGIAKVAEKKGLQVLLIDEDGIELEGLNKGFIGGSSCLINKKVWAISGNIEMLKSRNKIYNFLDEKGFDVISLTKKLPKDVGSIIPLINQ
ncbi:UNVERIFIED_CONTAM: hypothetical protein Cloal_3629 [Acetivibrio alkalicellulosi]